MHPILFKWGPLTIRSYGVMVLAGFLAGLWYVMSAARRRMAGHSPDEPGVITPDHVFDASLIGLFVGILGTRILYILTNWPEFAGKPLEMFKIWNGGQSFIGAPVLGFAFAWWFARRHKLPVLALLDMAGPGFAIASCIGRIGCFLNGCCYGHACNLPWAVQFPDERYAVYNSLHSPPILTPPSHPTELYESAMHLIAFFLLNRWIRRPHRDGEIVLGYVALYTVARFISEQFRKGATADIFIWNLTHAQAFCLVMFPVSIILLWRLRRKSASKETPKELVG